MPRSPKSGVPMSEELKKRFPPLPGVEGTGARSTYLIRNELGVTAHFLEVNLPDGREKSIALTKLEETMFWANASIALLPPKENSNAK